MKKLIIFCDGGLGNRLGVLVGGLIVSKTLQRAPVICWPQNTWCGCSYKDIFCNDMENISLNINELFSTFKDSLFLIHENQTNLSLHKQLYPTKEAINNLVGDQISDIIYYHNSIPEFLDKKQVLQTLQNLQIVPHIQDIVDIFCTQNNIDRSVAGVHLRKTDYNSLIDENQVQQYISENPEKRFFVCSDDKETEIKFSKNKNVIIRPKTFYAEKLDIDKSWCGHIIDREGRSFNFNVNRSKDSVIEGFIDLLILSKTNITIETISSFLKFAKLYNELNYDTDNS